MSLVPLDNVSPTLVVFLEVDGQAVALSLDSCLVVLRHVVSVTPIYPVPSPAKDNADFYFRVVTCVSNHTVTSKDEREVTRIHYKIATAVLEANR